MQVAVSQNFLVVFWQCGIGRPTVEYKEDKIFDKGCGKKAKVESGIRRQFKDHHIILKVEEKNMVEKQKNFNDKGRGKQIQPGCGLGRPTVECCWI